MKYSAFIEVYERLAATTKKLEKTEILAAFLKKLEKEGNAEWIYLLRGKAMPDYDMREFGISEKLAIKAMSSAFGVTGEKIVERYRKVGDLGDIASELAEKRAQRTLGSQELDAGKVFESLRKLLDVSGKGAVERKIGLVAELLGAATAREARYVIRTVLQDLRVGVADALLVDALARAYYEGKKEMKERLSEAYDMANDAAEVFRAAQQRKEQFDGIRVVPGRPMKVMLPVKVTSMEEAFRICGKPAALEHKYDGFRMLIHSDGKRITLFTRKLENVTQQFPDVAAAVKKHVKAASFILDSEVVGYEPGTKKAQPFEAVSQRIKRKYDIEKLAKKLPVEIYVFDVLYLDGKSVMGQAFKERRKLLERIIQEEQWTIRLATQRVTGEEREAERFYKEALKNGEEGIIMKALDAVYRSGRHVGSMVKLKPAVDDMDLVIVGAEYGSGKRAGWLTSYIVACREHEKFLEVGMVSSGLKEKEEEGMSYEEMTRLLKPLIVKEEGKRIKVKPKIVVAVTYQNIQVSPTYSSGYALRFPRITHYRPDKPVKEIATRAEIAREMKRVARGRR